MVREDILTNLDCNLQSEMTITLEPILLHQETNQFWIATSTAKLYPSDLADVYF